MTTVYSHFVQNLKTSKVLQEKNLKENLCNYIKDRINVKNVALYCKLADIYKFQTLAKVTLQFIERCFTMVSEDKSYLELDFARVEKILKSSELHITSELEVYEAAASWISYNTEDRSKYAEDLLLTVRLPLLSDSALNYILNDNSLICKTDECRAIIQSILQNKQNLVNKQLITNYTSRYCNQTLFNILICQQLESVRSVKLVHWKDCKSIKTYDTTAETDEPYKLIYLKGDVYMFVRSSNTMKIKKYLQTLSSWENVVDLNYRIGFSVCALINKIFIISGRTKCLKEIDSCIQYDTKDLKCKEINKMNMSRFHAACTVYEGKIVVADGWFDLKNGKVSLTNTVEVYDHVADNGHTCQIR